MTAPRRTVAAGLATWLCPLFLVLSVQPWLPSAGLAAAPEDVLPGRTEAAAALSSDEVKRRWHRRLDDRHFTARVRMHLNLAGLREERHLVVFRDDGDQHHERVLIRFQKPEDLRNVGLLYLEQPERANDYFFYSPATRRVRRLPPSYVDDNVYGIDLEFLGFGVSETEPTEVESMERVDLEGRAAYRLEERALASTRFEKRITWIDAEHFIPLRTEHFRRGKRTLVAETRSVREIQGVPTPVEMHFSRAGEGRDVILRVDEVDYEEALPSDSFSVMELIRRK